MKRLKNKFKSDSIKSEFVKNALTLISGTTLAQLIAIIITPLLSRIYTTEDFGVLNIYMSITGILSVVATMRYEMAVILPKKDEDAVNVMALSFFITSLWSILSLIAVFLFGHLISEFIGNKKASGFEYFIPLVVLLLGFVQVLNFWSIRLKTFKQNAYSRISNTSVNNGLALGLGYALKGPFGLILGFYIAQFASFVILSRSIFKNFKHYKSQVSWEKIKFNAKKYRNFPKVNTIHALIDSFQDNGIIFFMKNFFGMSVLGSYSFAFRLLKVPSGIISSAISQVFMEKATKAVNNGESILPLIKRIYKIVFLIGAPFFLLLFIFAADIFAFVFSENFRQAGVIAQILTPWLFLNFVANSASGVPVIFNKLHVPLIFTIADICLKIISLYIGWHFQSFHIGFMCMSISCSILILISFVWVFSIVSKNKINLFE